MHWKSLHEEQRNRMSPESAEAFVFLNSYFEKTTKLH